MEGYGCAELAGHFAPDAVIRWPNTREVFTVEEFVRANSEYPGDWQIAVERATEELSVIRASMGEDEYRAVSLFRFNGDKITELTEYWGDVGDPPAWRREKGIGQIERGN